MAVVDSRYRDNHLKRTRHRSLPGNRPHFSNPPRCLRDGSRYIEHHCHSCTTAPAANRPHGHPEVDNRDRPNCAADRDRDLQRCPSSQNLSATVTWQSSNAQVANVTSSGLVSGVGVGQTTITALATASDGSVISGTAAIRQHCAIRTDTDLAHGDSTQPNGKRNRRNSAIYRHWYLQRCAVDPGSNRSGSLAIQRRSGRTGAPSRGLLTGVGPVVFAPWRCNHHGSWQQLQMAPWIPASGTVSAGNVVLRR